VRFGDVLINSTGVGTLGRVVQVYEDIESCTVDSHVTIVRPISDIDVDFFGCALLA
jgi:type I restriction enzyme S subunit